MNPKIIDLSITLYHDMPIWPTQPNFIYEQTRNAARDGHTMHIIHQMTTHTGTHIDTPLHFIEEGASVDQIPIEHFAGEGVVIDLSHKKPRSEITIQDLEKYGNKIKTNDVLMLHTGWDKKIGFNSEYLFEWPYLTAESSKYLVEKQIKALGIDTMSVGRWEEDLPAHPPVASKGSIAETHRILLGAGIILIETIRNLDQVLQGAETRRAYFIYAPITIRGAEAGPCRAVALIFP